MQRRTLLAFCIATALGLNPAFSQTIEERYVTQLQAQGFFNIVVKRTWLGRIRITASTKTKTREIIFNPNSGEVLRDYWDDADGSGLLSELLDLGSGGAASNGGAQSGGSSGGSSGGASGGSSGGSGGGGGGNDASFNYLSGGPNGDIDFELNSKSEGIK